jgi:hypothetical protein
MGEPADKIKFAFEDLEVWQKAVEFAAIAIRLIEGTRANLRQKNKLLHTLRLELKRARNT